ncbi:26S proteasome non-ATPase regulatory subunit 1-like protein, partial [Leptotrombidium deliense]
MRMYPKMMITSASGVISLLDEEKAELQSFALHKLDEIVDEFWAEISEVITKIEVLYENENFSQRKLAALVASKVYYHLGSFEDSLTFALGAGELFDVNSNTEYVQTTIAKCIDHYTKERARILSGREKEKIIDPRLEQIVDRMFKRCFDDGQYKQSIGIALETRRMDIFEKSIVQSNDMSAMLEYAYKITMSLVDNRNYRKELLKLLVKLYSDLKVPDYVNVCQCLIFLDD